MKGATMIDVGKLVLCGVCGKAYDSWDVHVIARYADCSVYRTPCCDTEVDDRPWVRKVLPIDPGAVLVDGDDGPLLVMPMSHYGVRRIIPIARPAKMSPGSVKINDQEVTDL